MVVNILFDFTWFLDNFILKYWFYWLFRTFLYYYIDTFCYSPLTITIFEVDRNDLSTPDLGTKIPTFALFPNPAKANETIYFNRTADVTVYDINGKVMMTKKEAQTLDCSSLSSGIYLVTTSEGITKRLIIK